MEQTLSANLGEPIDGTATESLSPKREREVVLKLRLQHNHSGPASPRCGGSPIFLLVPSRPRTDSA
jgi:hypothetical protein